MMALSALCRSRGNPVEARQAIARAQCNDAYWHGVFGGLYLPHLRHAIWRNLALAETELRRGGPPQDGGPGPGGGGFGGIWGHSARFSPAVGPPPGGAIAEYARVWAGV